MDDSNLDKLLTQVGEIHNQAEQDRRDSGDRFNVFSVLRKPHDEVGLHSSFLHFLLDPKGTHDQGPIFLQAFLNHAGLTLSGDLSKVRAYREKDNIDILLRSRTEAIVIENKIYAVDQKRQLQRYRETLLGKGVDDSRITLVYLTLDGNEPEDMSELDKNRVELIKYSDHILSWLDECIKLMALKPRIRESLNQYQDIVRRLTGLMGTKAETDAVVRLLLQDQNYVKAQLIQQAMLDARVEVHEWFWNTLKRMLCGLGYELHQPHTHYDAAGYRNFLKKKKGGNPKLAFKLGVYERMDFIVTIQCIHRSNTLGVKSQLFDPVKQKLFDPDSFDSLRDKVLRIVPDSKTTRYSLASTHKWPGLDMRHFSDDEARNFPELDTEHPVQAMKRLINELVPVFEQLKAVNRAGDQGCQ